MSSNKTKITLTVDNNDPLAKYSIEGVAKFSTGVDNMNDSFKIGTGSTLANPALEIDSSGNVTIKNNLVVEGTQFINLIPLISYNYYNNLIACCNCGVIINC